MEVFKSNFSDVIAELEDVISSAEFLAIDGEFTGLTSGQDVGAYDTPAQYYAKLRSSSMDFLLVQLGLCAFNYDKENDKFTHRAYNFYVFPRPHSRSAPDPRFLCQSSSVDFLISQGFDFNKLFKKGIPYLREAEEKKLRENLEEKIKARANNSSPKNDETSVPIPEELTSVIDDVCTRIQEFLDSDEQEELTLDRHNGFVRKLIYQTVRERFTSEQVRLETKTLENQNRVLIVTRGEDEKARKRREEEKNEQDRRELEAAVGVSHVIKLISQSGKLIIGHNILLDLCHIIHQFCMPLPESYTEFKELVTFLFPRVLDTKFMSCNAPFKDLISSTVLGHLTKTLSEDPFEVITADAAEEGKGYSSTEEKAHEAGYDAYVTGLCFLAMCQYLGSTHKPAKRPVLSSSPLLKSYINKLHLMRIQDMPFVDLTGSDPVPPRSHVFHVSFPKEWKMYDLTQLFSPFGTIHVSWLNETSAFIGLHRREQADLVMKTLTQSDTYSVIPYARYQIKLQKQLDTQCNCLRKKTRTVPCSPTTVAHKRRSLEKLVQETEQQQQPTTRKRSRSFGEYSKRNIETIPEEEDAEMNSSPAKRSKAKLDEVSNGRAVDKKQFQESDTWE